VIVIYFNYLDEYLINLINIDFLNMIKYIYTCLCFNFSIFSPLFYKLLLFFKMCIDIFIDFFELIL
jgi:hypothetical protein